MAHIIGHATKNSLATMLDPSQPSSLAPPSSDTNSSQPPHLLSSSHKVPHSGLLKVLGILLPHIMAALQSPSTPSLVLMTDASWWVRLFRAQCRQVLSPNIHRYLPLQIYPQVVSLCLLIWFGSLGHVIPE